MVTERGDIIVAQGQYTVSVGGGQPNTGAPSVSANIEVNGQVMLPE
jgi:beta-glucosidase